MVGLAYPLALLAPSVRASGRLPCAYAVTPTLGGLTDDPAEHPEPVAVSVHSDRCEAEVTVAHLAANGMEAFIVDEVEGGLVPIEGEWGVAVAAQAQDAEPARQVLAQDEATE